MFRSKTGQLKTVYKNDSAAITSDLDLSLSSGPIVNGSFVLGFQGNFNFLLLSYVPELFISIIIFFSKLYFL